MKHRRIKFISAFVTLLLSSFFRVFLLLFSYITIVSLNESSSAAKQVPVSTVINFIQIMPPVVLLVEALCYIFFRKRYFVRKLVRWHLWMTIISSVLLPIVEFAVLMFILPSAYDSRELSSVVTDYEAQFIFIGWTLFTIARLFFIVAMVKSVTSLNEQKPEDESTGFLDDFAQ
ncbi:hypothetical protein ESA94_05225 [Lacibacter luteus]|uniref:Uncharacterized protein n=1 Tax=Lacibacter luteus TaxID=2508719 RepID=A0A4Q1CNW0_9BACT|nr:hypothetical protein [Lacibacter luteus]RXK62411.1 hypothetical protein ESA94_05225 [Lacibacter luteus]